MNTRRKYFKVNDLLYAVVVGYGGVNKYHQFARVEYVSESGKYKISIFPTLRDGDDYVIDDIKYTPVRPNFEVIRCVRFIQSTGYQSDIDCTYVKYNPDIQLYDMQEQK